MIGNGILTADISIPMFLTFGPLLLFSGTSEDPVWIKASRCSLVCPCRLDAQRRAHRSHPDARGWRRYELQTFGFSRTCYGLERFNVSPFYMQRFKPCLQSEGLSCCLGKIAQPPPLHVYGIIILEIAQIAFQVIDCFPFLFTRQEYLKSLEKYAIKYTFLGGKP